MSYNSAKFVLNEYLRVIKLQLLIGLISVIIVLILTQNMQIVLSTAGGLCLAVIPTAIYIKTAWSRKVLNAEQVFARHKKAELLKFMSSILAFVVLFVCFKRIHFLALFTTYVAVLSSYWLSLFISGKKKI